MASEVRKLAERSQAAAQEISELSQSTKTVSGDAGQLLDALVPEIQRTAELVADISSGAREQSTGVDQIQQAIGDVNSVTSMYQDLATQAAKAADEMALQTTRLTDLMDQEDQTVDHATSYAA